MPRGIKLSDHEKGQIEAFKSSGDGFREIARKLNRSDRVIRNYLKNPAYYNY